MCDGDNDVEIINTNIINQTNVQNNDKCVHCSSGYKWQNMLRAKFGNIQSECLLDSGASLNVVSSNFLSKIPQQFVEKLPHRNTIILGVGNYQTKVDCRVRLTFKINNTKFTDDFYCFNNTFNVILGWPFLKRHNSNVNFDTSEVTLDGSKLPMHAPSTRSTMVTTCRDEIINALTISEIRVKLAKPVTNGLDWIAFV